MSSVIATDHTPLLALPESSSEEVPRPAKMTRALWSAMALEGRVPQSGVMTAQVVAEVLSISLGHALNLLRESGRKKKVAARTGAEYGALVTTLYARRSKDSFAWARKLESTLGLRKQKGALHVVPGEETAESSGTIEPADEKTST